MKEEIHSMNKNGLWSLVDMSKLAKTIKCKWVFTRKRNIEENGER